MPFIPPPEEDIWSVSDETEKSNDSAHSDEVRTEGEEFQLKLDLQNLFKPERNGFNPTCVRLGTSSR